MVRTLMPLQTLFEKHQWSLSDKFQVITLTKNKEKVMIKVLGNLTKIQTKRAPAQSKKSCAQNQPFFHLTVVFKSSTTTYKLLPAHFQTGLRYLKTDGTKTVTMPNDGFINYVSAIKRGNMNNSSLTGLQI
jgi:hypothetical protein